jgi:transcriptional regulator with XRE-family HTH domain
MSALDSVSNSLFSLFGYNTDPYEEPDPLLPDLYLAEQENVPCEYTEPLPPCDWSSDPPDYSEWKDPQGPLLNTHIQSATETAEKVRVIGGEVFGAEGLTKGQLILKLRHNRHLSQTDLGRETGIHRGLISRYQRDKGRITKEQSALLAAAFGIADRERFYTPKIVPVFVKDGRPHGEWEHLTRGMLVRALREGRGLTPQALSNAIGGRPTGVSIVKMERSNTVSKHLAELAAKVFGLADYTLLYSVKQRPRLQDASIQFGEMKVKVVAGKISEGDGLASNELLFALRKGYPGHLSQRKLGWETEITAIQISRYETGSARISQINSAKLAKFFGIEDLQIFCTVETTNSKKRKRSDGGLPDAYNEPFSERIIRVDSPVRPPLSPCNSPF